ncbi:S-methyl-5-thioribose-1-phosphate isomerase [bacterium]|nr:MAG: S-methyl-5-thioribose-1-phosphate isomerase [bacterium]
METIRWANDSIRIIDQTALPKNEVYLNISSIDELIDSIKKLKVRGAPALGIAGAYGMVLGMQELIRARKSISFEKVNDIADRLIESRPTAINLKWGVSRIKKIIELKQVVKTSELMDSAMSEAHAVLTEDIQCCLSLGRQGSALIKDKFSILTHCNTGGLATGGFGTALGVLVTAHQQHKRIHVYVDETRPLMQGTRLTSWELIKEGIDHTIIADSMAGYLMAQNKVDCVIVGADRIAKNGDSANKIGTYSLAVLCEKHKVPFYVAAPTSTIDSIAKNGHDIPIEERNPDEITHYHGNRIAPAGARAYNPAFDVTPATMITAIITEKNIYKGPHYNFADC